MQKPPGGTPCGSLSSPRETGDRRKVLFALPACPELSAHLRIERDVHEKKWPRSPPVSFGGLFSKVRE